MRVRVGALAGTVLALTFAAASTLAAQAAASVCKDGTTSTATGRGACSGHGGVDAKATEAAKKAATKTEKAASKSDAAAAKTTAKTEKATDKAVDKSAAKSAKTEAAAAKTEAKTAKSETKAETKTAKAESKPVEKSTSKPKTGADNNDPTNATAQCKDGTYSHAKNHQGACSNHGGVAKFLK